MTTISYSFINNLSKNLQESLKCSTNFQRTKKISETEIFRKLVDVLQENHYRWRKNGMLKEEFMVEIGKQVTILDSNQ